MCIRTLSAGFKRASLWIRDVFAMVGGVEVHAVPARSIYSSALPTTLPEKELEGERTQIDD
jgi:hypothetical protein